MNGKLRSVRTKRSPLLRALRARRRRTARRSPASRSDDGGRLPAPVRQGCDAVRAVPHRAGPGQRRRDVGDGRSRAGDATAVAAAAGVSTAALPRRVFPRWQRACSRRRRAREERILRLSVRAEQCPRAARIATDHSGQATTDTAGRGVLRLEFGDGGRGGGRCGGRLRRGRHRRRHGRCCLCGRFRVVVCGAGGRGSEGGGGGLRRRPGLSARDPRQTATDAQCSGGRRRSGIRGRRGSDYRRRIHRTGRHSGVDRGDRSRRHRVRHRLRGRTGLRFRCGRVDGHRISGRPGLSTRHARQTASQHPRRHGYFFRASRAAITCGTTANTSPTMPKSATSKIGASGSLLIATMFFDVCMPARCWIAPEMPSATYSCGDTDTPV